MFGRGVEYFSMFMNCRLTALALLWALACLLPPLSGLNSAAAIDPLLYGHGFPELSMRFSRPDGTDLFSGSQNEDIQDYCDGLNIADYNCRRISSIYFSDIGTGDDLPEAWDANHSSVKYGELSPPYDPDWGDDRMVASPRMTGFFFSCMILTFDPPIPAGWNMEFLWTVGARHDDGDTVNRGTAVDVRFRANTDRVEPDGSRDSITLTNTKNEFRENLDVNSFLQWTRISISGFSPSSVPEVRWCAFSSGIKESVRNLARVDGLLFGTDREEFCRDCHPGHNDFIDRYCIALDISSRNCQRVSRLVFSRTGVGDHVWTPISDASAIGGGRSVLSPPVKKGEYSCMSLHLAVPKPEGETFSIVWGLSLSRTGQTGKTDAAMRLFSFVPGGGADHDPTVLTSARLNRTFGSSSEDFSGWPQEPVQTLATEVGEFKWCYYGGNPKVGELDRGRVDRLRISELPVISPEAFANGIPRQVEVLARPSGVGIFSSTTQSQSIRDYCDGLNISDHNCRRIHQIRFLGRNLTTDTSSFWDDFHEGVTDGDSDPPYHERWGDERMLASPAITADSSSYSCMALVFDPPIPAGWNMEFRWTVGARHDDGDEVSRATAVDVRLRANSGFGSAILLTEEQNRSRQNVDVDGFLPWQYRSFTDFDRPVPEARWCFFSSDILAAERNLARIDGVLFGTDNRQEFSRPEHNDFIDRYCAALNLTGDNCRSVSRLAFSRTGVGEHVWDPTHAEASAEGGSFSVLSPPVRNGEYSCMSMFRSAPNPPGTAFSFDWDLSRRAEVSGETGQENALMRFYFFAPGGGADHDPLNSIARPSDGFLFLRPTGSGWHGWTTQPISPATEAEELKWCNYGGNSAVGERDRGRIDRLRIRTAFISPEGYENGIPQQTETLTRPSGVGLFSSSTQSRSIRDYCDGLNISDYNCRRISRIRFVSRNFPVDTSPAWDDNHLMVASGDLDPPYYDRWGNPMDPRMVATPAIDGADSDSVGLFRYSCMALVFDPPVPAGWNTEFRWTVGAKHDTGESTARGTVVDVRFGAETLPGSAILLTDEPGRSRQNLSVDGFLPWQVSGIDNFERPVPEVRWCFFSSDILPAERNLARIDGVLFGTTQTQSFCRPERNAGDDSCLAGHNHFIDRYCAALDLPMDNCLRVSRLAFSRTGIGEHVWDPTHNAASDGGVSLSVLSPPVRKGEYSCMSLYLGVPSPPEVEFGFTASVNRRAMISSETETVNAYLQFYSFTPEGGDNHIPRYEEVSARLRITPDSSGWSNEEVTRTPSIETGELKWCYFGGNPEVGEQDRGRINSLQLGPLPPSPEDYANGVPEQAKTLVRPPGVGIFSSTTQSRSIRDYCDGLNISDHNCRRISRIHFFARGLPAESSLVWDSKLVPEAEVDDGVLSYDRTWADRRLLVSPAIAVSTAVAVAAGSDAAGFSSYSCMALVFDPPIPSGWNMQFRWTVGARHDSGESTATATATAVDVRFRATLSRSAILLTDERSRSRQNFSIDGFLPWQLRRSDNFDNPVPEVRWCFFSSDILPADRNLASIDGVLLGAAQTQAFCRPELNADDDSCLSGHNEFIDRYCTALELSAVRCRQVSRLAFSSGGEEDTASIGEQVWDPTHTETSTDSSSFSVLSPPVGGGEYSCMSLHFNTPIPLNDRFSFAWDLGHRAKFDGEEALRNQPNMLFYFFAPGTGAAHDPFGLSASTPDSAIFGYSAKPSGFQGWADQRGINDAFEVEEFKWCYYGRHSVAGAQDRGRIDRFRFEGEPPLLPQDYANGAPEQTETLVRPTGVGIFSSTTQSQSIRDYCDGLNISDYNCRRISGIAFFAQNLLPDITPFWDNDHMMVAPGDLDPPYDPGWGDSRMVAAPAITATVMAGPDAAGLSGYSCMALFFDPPIPSGWNMQFRWTVGARHDTDDGVDRGTAVDVRFGADTQSGSTILLTDEPNRSRRNGLDDGFLPWQVRDIDNFDRPVPEVRWCFFSSNILPADRNLARIDGVQFGTIQTQAFCRPELNADDDSCLSGHNEFIDRYCTALDLSAVGCRQVSRLAFSGSGIGEHVWDPTHAEASAKGSSSSVLSPPVRKGEYSCMSLFLAEPHAQGGLFSFAWDLNRRVGFDGEEGRVPAFMRLYLLAPETGDDHDPLKGGSNGSQQLESTASGWQGWATESIGDPANSVGELKWCYFGGNVMVGERDRGRVDRLELPPNYANGLPDQSATLARPPGVGLFSDTAQSRGIRDYCDGLNISDYSCRRISRIDFFARDLPTGASVLWDHNHNRDGYDQDWGDPRMVASPAIDGADPDAAGFSSYSCMALVFDPPLPAGWNMEFRWTVGAGRSTETITQTDGAIAVDLRFGADTQSGSAIVLNRQSDRFLRNTDVRGFLPWQFSRISDFGSPVPEVRWCVFSAMIPASEDNLARIDGVLFGTDQTQAFCRPELNANDGNCLPEHNEFIDRYCAALDISLGCELVSRLGFSRNGVGEPVWDPTHNKASEGGGSSSVLSPPVRGGEYSCMSLYFATPNPSGEAFGFAWALGRRAEYDGEEKRVDASLQFFFFAAGAGAGHDPLDLGARSSDADLSLEATKSGFSEWEAEGIIDPATESEELKWCYYGGNPELGEQDRGRIDRLQIGGVPASPRYYANGRPEQTETLLRPAGVGIFSDATQSRSIRDYCDGLNMSDYNCRRISRIRFVAKNLPADTAPLWDNKHMTAESGDRDADWGDLRMVASPAIDGADSGSAGFSSYSCMALVFDPPVPAGWNMEFRWTVGVGLSTDSQTAATAVDLRFGADTRSDSTILLNSEPNRFRLNAEGNDFLPWQYRGFTDLDSPVPEVRWCFFSSNIPAADRNLARIDGVLLGSNQTQIFSRLEHSDFIDRYCTALDLAADGCSRVSRLAFSRTGVGESVWDPTYGVGSPGGGSSSVLSPPVRAGEYSCMSLYLNPPNPQGAAVSFQWALSRRAGADDDPNAALNFYFFAPGGGDDHVPINEIGERSTSTATVSLSGADSGFGDRVNYELSAPATPVGELKWCYLGGNPAVGNDDRGRVDQLQISNAITTVFARAEIAEYCTALNMSLYSCQRLSGIAFGAGAGASDSTRLWSVSEPGSPNGGLGGSLRSPEVMAGDYRCMSLLFEPPIQRGWDVAFDWMIGGGGAVFSFHHFAVAADVAAAPPNSNAAANLGNPSEWTPDVVKLPAAAGALRWCYFGGETGESSVAGAVGSGRLDRLVLSSTGHALVRPADREPIGEYCTALKLGEPLCDRLSGVGFARTGEGDPVWGLASLGDSDSPAGSSGIVSPRIAEDAYSCVSLLWEPPLPVGDQLTVQTVLFRSGETTARSRVRAWMEPGADHVPQYDGQGFVESIPNAAANGNGLTYPDDEMRTGSGGVATLLLAVEQPGSELKICYFGAVAAPVILLEDHGASDVAIIANLEYRELDPVLSSLDSCQQLFGGGCDLVSLGNAPARLTIGGESRLIEWLFVYQPERGPVLFAQPTCCGPANSGYDRLDLAFSKAFHREYLLYGFSLHYRSQRAGGSLQAMFVRLGFSADTNTVPAADRSALPLPQDQQWRYFEYPLELGAPAVSNLRVRYEYFQGLQQRTLLMGGEEAPHLNRLSLNNILLRAVPRQLSSAAAFCTVAMAGGSAGDNCAQLAPVAVAAGAQPFVPGDRPWRVMAGETGNGEALFSPAAAFHPQADYRRPVCLRLPVAGPRVLSALSFRYRLSGQSSASVLASAFGAEAVELARLPTSPDWSDFEQSIDPQQRFSDFWLCHHRDWLNPQDATDVFGIDEITVQTTLPDLCQADSAPAMTDRCRWPNAAAGISSAVSVAFEPPTRPWRLGAGREADGGALYSPLGIEPSCLRLELAEGERLRRVSFSYRFGEAATMPLRVELQTPVAQSSLAVLTPVAGWSSFGHTFSNPYRGPRVSAVLLCHQRHSRWQESDTVAVTEPGLETATAVQSVAGLALTPAFAFRQMGSGPPRLYSAAWLDGSGRLHLGIELRLLDRYGNQVMGSSSTASLRVQYRGALSLDVAGGGGRLSATGELVVQSALQIGASGSAFADIGIEPEPGMAVDTTVLVEFNGPPGLSALREYRLLDICQLSLAGGAAGSACREFGDTVLAVDNGGADRPWERQSGGGSSGDYLQSPAAGDDSGNCLRLWIAEDQQLRGLSFRYRAVTIATVNATAEPDRSVVAAGYFRLSARLPGEESGRSLADLPLVPDWTPFAYRAEVILPAATDISLCYREPGADGDYRYRVGVDDLALEPLSVAEDFCAEVLVGGGDGADCETLNTAALSFAPPERPWHFAAIELTEGLALRRLAGGKGGLSCLRLPVAGGRLLREFSFRYRLEPEGSPATLIVRLGRGDGPEEQVAELPALGGWRDFRYRVRPFDSPPRVVSLCYSEPDGSAAGAGLAALDQLQLQSLDIVEDFCELAVRGGATGQNCAVLGPADRSVPRVEFAASGSDWALISGDRPGQFAVYSSRQSCLRLKIGAEWQLQRVGFRYRQGAADGDNMELRLVGGVTSVIQLGRDGKPAGNWVDIARTVNARIGRVSRLSLCYRDGGDDVAEAARAAVTALVLEARPLAPDVSGGLEDFCDRLVVGGRDGPSCAALSPLDSEGSVAAFEPPERPWQLYREDGSRGTVLQSGMLGDGEHSCVRLRVRADRQLHGFSLAYRHSVEEYYDFLVIYADRGLGDRWEVGRFSGEAPWTSYAVQVPLRRGPLSGISLCYERDSQGGGGNDLVAIDSLALQTTSLGVTVSGRSLYLRAPLQVLQLGSRPVEVPVLLSVLVEVPMPDGSTSTRYDYGELENVVVELEGSTREFALRGLDLGVNSISGMSTLVRLVGLTVSPLSFSLAARLRLADGQDEATATVSICGGSAEATATVSICDFGAESTATVSISGGGPTATARIAGSGAVFAATVDIPGADLHGSQLEFRVVEFCTLAVADGRAGEACTALSEVVESAVVEPSPEGLWRASRVLAGGERNALLAFAQDDGDTYESCLRLRLSAQHVLSELSFDYRTPPEGAGLFLRLLGPTATDVRELGLPPSDGASWRSFTYAPAADLAGLRELAWCYYREDAVFGEQAAAGLSKLRLSGHSRGAQADFCELAVRGGRSGTGCQSLRSLDATGSRVEYRPQSRPWRAGTAETGEALLLSDGLAAGENSCLRLRLAAGLVLLDIGFRYRVMAAGDGGLRLYWLRDGVAESSTPVRSLSASAWTDVMVATTPQPRVVVGIALCHEGGSGGTGEAWLDDVYLATGARESQPRQPGSLTVLGPPRVFALGPGRPAEFNFRVEVMDTVGRSFIGELPEPLWLDVSTVAAETTLSLQVLGSEERQDVGRVELRDLGLGAYGELSSLLTVALPAGMEGTTVAVRVGGLSGVEEYELEVEVSDFCAVALSADADCEEFAAVVGSLSFSAERSPWAVAAAGQEGSALYAASSPGGEQRNCLRLHVAEQGRLSGLGFDYRTLPGAGGSLSLLLRFSGRAEDQVVALFPGSADWDTAEYALEPSAELLESLALCYHGAADESAAVAGLLLDNLALELNVPGPGSPPRSADALRDFCDIAVLGGRDGTVCRLLQPVDYRGNRVEYTPRTRPWVVAPAEDPSALALRSVGGHLDPGCVRLRLKPPERLLGFLFRYSLTRSSRGYCERLQRSQGSCTALEVFGHDRATGQQRLLASIGATFAVTTTDTWQLFSYRLEPEFAAVDRLSLCSTHLGVEFAVDDIALVTLAQVPAVPAALRLHGPERVFSGGGPQTFKVRVELLDALGRLPVPNALELELWVVEPGGSTLSLSLATAPEDVEFGTELLRRRLSTVAPSGVVDLLLSVELPPNLPPTVVTVSAAAGDGIEASIDIPIIDFCALALADSSVAPLCAAIGEIAFDPPDKPWRVLDDGTLVSAVAVGEDQHSCLQLRFLPRSVQGPALLTAVNPRYPQGPPLSEIAHGVSVRHEFEDRQGRVGLLVLSEVSTAAVFIIRPGDYAGPYAGNPLTEFLRSVSVCHQGQRTGPGDYIQLDGLRALTNYNVFAPLASQQYSVQDSAGGGRLPIMQLKRSSAELLFSGNLSLGGAGAVKLPPGDIVFHIDDGIQSEPPVAYKHLFNEGSPLGLPAILQTTAAVQFGVRIDGLNSLDSEVFFRFVLEPSGDKFGSFGGLEISAPGHSEEVHRVSSATVYTIPEVSSATVAAGGGAKPTARVSSATVYTLPVAAGVDGAELLLRVDLGGLRIARLVLEARTGDPDGGESRLLNALDFVVVDICALVGSIGYVDDRTYVTADNGSRKQVTTRRLSRRGCGGFRDLAELRQEPAQRQPWRALRTCDDDNNLDQCFITGLYSPPTPAGEQSCVVLRVVAGKYIEQFAAVFRISAERHRPGVKAGDVVLGSLFREDAPQTPQQVFLGSGLGLYRGWNYSAADDLSGPARVVGLSFCYRKDEFNSDFDDSVGVSSILFKTADAPGRRLHLQGPVLALRVREQDSVQLDLAVSVLPPAENAVGDVSIGIETVSGEPPVSQLAVSVAGTVMESDTGMIFLPGLELPETGRLPIRLNVNWDADTTLSITAGTGTDVGSAELLVTMADFCSVAVLGGSGGEACAAVAEMVGQVVPGPNQFPWRLTAATTPDHDGLTLSGPVSMPVGRRSCLRLELRPDSSRLLTGFSLLYRFRDRGQHGEFAVLLERERLGELSEELLFTRRRNTQIAADPVVVHRLAFTHTVELSRGGGCCGVAVLSAAATAVQRSWPGRCGRGGRYSSAFSYQHRLYRRWPRR